MSRLKRLSASLLWLGAVQLGSSCYMARIDLRELASDETGGASSARSMAGEGGVVGEGVTAVEGGAAGEGGAAISGGAGGEGGNAGDGGDAGRAGAGAGAGGDGGSAGAGGDTTHCDNRTVLEPLQEECHLSGPPSAATCHEAAPDGWVGCINGTCNVCAGLLRDYPYYRNWHPCCSINTTCTTVLPYPCNERCPAPTEHDRIPPCGLTELQGSQ